MVCKILAGVNTTKTKEHIVFQRRRKRRGGGGGSCLSGHRRMWKKLDQWPKISVTEKKKQRNRFGCVNWKAVDGKTLEDESKWGWKLRIGLA